MLASRQAFFTSFKGGFGPDHERGIGALVQVIESTAFLISRKYVVNAANCVN